MIAILVVVIVIGTIDALTHLNFDVLDAFSENKNLMAFADRRKDPKVITQYNNGHKITYKCVNGYLYYSIDDKDFVRYTRTVKTICNEE